MQTLVREAHSHGVAVCFGMDDHGGQSHFLAGAVNPQRDLAAVCDENLLDNGLVSHITRSE